MTPTFGKVRFGATNGVAPLSMGLPPASYPGAVATNAHLVVAVDRLQTRLAVPLAATDTVMQVESGAGIVASCLLTIDNEIVQALSGSGTSWTIGRGFDGTTPALHLASSVVSGFVDAWHHNTLVAEVQAIEQALGPNLSRIPAVPFVVSSAFDFPVATPGGNLVVGANVITLSPVPLGVNGSDTNHYLYISGGTGTAEAVPIIGGTAVGGAASGTVIVTAAHTHSGTWQIASATGGIQEAILYACANGSLSVYLKTCTVHATITIPASCGSEIFGAGTSATTITAAADFDTAGGDILSYATSSVGRFSMHDFAIVAGAGHASGANIAIRGMSSGFLSNIFALGGFNGILIDGGNGFFSDNIHLLAYANIGVYLHATTVTGGRHHGWTMSGQDNSQGSLLIEAVTGGGATAGLNFSDLSFQGGQIGIQIYANGGVCNEMVFSNLILDSNKTVGIRMIGSGGGNGIHINNLRGSMATAPLIDTYGGFSDISLVGGSGTAGGNSTGMVIRGTQNFTIADFNMAGGGSAGANDICLLISTDPNTNQATANLKVSNSSFGFTATGAPGSATQGLVISPAAHTNLHISDSDFSGNSQNINDSNLNPTIYTGYVRGMSDTVPTVASATTLTFPRMAQGGTVQITGNAGVTAVAGLYKGQTGFIQTAAAVPFTAGSSIGTTVTTTPNTLTPWWFDGTKLWLR